MVYCTVRGRRRELKEDEAPQHDVVKPQKARPGSETPMTHGLTYAPPALRQFARPLRYDFGYGTATTLNSDTYFCPPETTQFLFSPLCRSMSRRSQVQISDDA